MNPADWLVSPVDSLLDVGCNVGAWLADCRRRFPGARLAGVEINQPALDQARAALPGIELERAGAEQLPFPDDSFKYVTCLEVLEHITPELRERAFREMWRVLRPQGRLILTVPHAGWFAWLDSNNVRFRLPNLYRKLLGGGRRDRSYAVMDRRVEWHRHFTQEELERLAGPGWRLVAARHGGLVLYPLMDWLSWPFYRAGVSQHPLRLLFQRIAGWDYQMDYGRASYGIMVVLEKQGRGKSEDKGRVLPAVREAESEG